MAKRKPKNLVQKLTTQVVYVSSTSVESKNELLDIMQRLGIVRAESYNKLGSVRFWGMDWHNAYPEVRSFRTPESLGLPSKLMEWTVSDVAKAILAQQAATIANLSSRIFARYPGDENKGIRKICYEKLKSTAFLSDSFLHRIVRKEFQRGHTRADNQIVYQPGGYSCKKISRYFYKLELAGLAKGKRVCVVVNSNRKISGQIRLIFNKEFSRFEIHFLVNLGEFEQDNATLRTEIGIDKGYTEAFFDSQGRAHGKRLGTLLTKKSNRICNKNRNRGKLFALYRKAKQYDPAKAARILENNLTRKTENKRYRKDQAVIASLVGSASKSLFEEGFLKVYAEDLTLAIRNKRQSKAMSRKLNSWVSTPSDLIQDKRRTPFNIGCAIDLSGFQIQEAQPLARGLAGVGNPQVLMQTVLDWTGGQPFLTQKVCKLVLSAGTAIIPIGEEAAWVERLVRERVIENWEAQDEPEHLKTIRDRILCSGDQRTGRLLGLCQQILQQAEIAADDSPEQTELRLTGLVVKRDGKLRIYNFIYAEVFNQEWCNKQLAKLRPYADALNTWVASKCQDESRLLRGQALEDAQEWSAGKSLSDLDYQFLAASQEAEKRDIKIALELQKDATAKANKILSKAQSRAKQIVRFGFVIFSVTVLLSLVFTIVLPWLAIVFNNRGFAKYEAGEIQDAIQHYELVLKLQPDYVQALYNQGLAYEDLQDFNSASANYENAILKNKNFAPAYNNLARLYITHRKEYLTTVKLLNEALQLSQKNLNAEELAAYKNVEYLMLKNLGWAQFGLRRYSEATVTLNQAITLDNQRGSAYCLLGQVLEVTNNKIKPKKEWEKCLQFADPSHPDEKEWINLAKQHLKE